MSGEQALSERVVLYFDADCPNAEPARALLREVLAELGQPPAFGERRFDAPDVPEAVRGLGSPTFAVDGRDVFGELAASENAACRIYRSADGRPSGLPGREALRDALARALDLPVDGAPQGRADRGAVGSAQASGCASGSCGCEPTQSPTSQSPRKGGLGGLLAALGAGFVALLPAVTCPACLPAYLAFLSSIGVAGLLTDAVLMPLVSGMLLLSVGSMAWGAWRRTGRWAPVALAAVAAVAVVAGRWAWDAPWLRGGGVVLLLLASMWHLLLQRRGRAPATRGSRTAAVGAVSALLLGLLAPGSAHAQVLHYWVQVEGLDCPMCVAGLKKSLGALEGVGKLKANFEHRQLRFEVRGGRILRPEQVREAIDDGGFRAGSMTVRVRGTLSADGTSVTLRGADGTTWTLALDGAEAAKLRDWAAHGKRAVRLVGRLRRREGRWRLQVQRLAHEPWREPRARGNQDG